MASDQVVICQLKLTRLKKKVIPLKIMYNGNLLIWSPMGQKDLVTLTGCPYYRGRL